MSNVNVDRKALVKSKKPKSGSKKPKSGSKRSTKKAPSRKQKKPKKKITLINFVNYFWDNIDNYLTDDTIRTYLQILDIDLKILANVDKNGYLAESKKLVKALIKHRTITAQIYQYLVTKVSKIEFLKKFSEEQVKYIINLDLTDTKLISTAGSGKTQSIIGRIKFIVEHGLTKKEEVFAVTFSKHAALDFHFKIKDLFPNYNEFCQLKNLSTIDALAKSILCRVKAHKSESVEILSIALRNYLREMPDTDIETVSAIKNIKHLFVDEAQDLNEVQYDILVLFRQKFGTNIHLIGDPCQNIYQFRRSSSAYLINFPAKQYELTLNFRSTQQIIDFSESLKPIQTTKAISATGKSGPRVTILTKSTSEIHKLILQFIKLYGKEKDLSDVAIVSPTRGIGAYDTVGLSVFFNLFKTHNIPFRQAYNESGTNGERKRDIGRIPGHVNLLTIHSTKGLEFDVVFVLDFYHNLFNIRPTEDEHKINQYLLYVSTSRAISMMFICTYLNVHSGYLNHWITKVPPQYYFSPEAPRIPQLTFRSKEKGGAINGITELIEEMSDEHLNMIHDMLKVDEGHGTFTRRIYKDYTHIARGKDEVLFGIFCEELFYLQHHLARRMPPRRFGLIRKIIDSKFIIVENESDYKFLKSYIVKNQLTWSKYDTSRNTMPDRLCQLIDKYFTREKELNDYVVCTNEFIKIIEKNTTDIKKTYIRYLDPAKYNYNYKEILLDFFYLIVVQYSHDNNHYYYISKHGAEKQDLLYNGLELYEAMNKYVSTNYLRSELDLKVNVYYPKMMLCGEIDFIEKYPSLGTETIVDIKCVKEISIKYYIQLLLYNFCYYYQQEKLDLLFKNKFKLLNLLTGVEHNLIIKISPANMFNLLIILAEIGNLNFNNMNLVYDLETNDGIQTIGPLNHKPNVARCVARKEGDKYYGKVYPEIIEIAVKDYDTGMVLIDTLVIPNNQIKIWVQEITGIRPLMLVGKPNIERVQKVLERKMRNFINCKMLSHNGAMFDDNIILADKLVDTQKVSFLDTLRIIPIHMPVGTKLESKSLGKIYHKLFGKNFNAHRSMADVDALIKIMRYLKVEF